MSPGTWQLCDALCYMIPWVVSPPFFTPKGWPSPHLARYGRGYQCATGCNTCNWCHVPPPWYLSASSNICQVLHLMLIGTDYADCMSIIFWVVNTYPPSSIKATVHGMREEQGMHWSTPQHLVASICHLNLSEFYVMGPTRKSSIFSWKIGRTRPGSTLDSEHCTLHLVRNVTESHPQHPGLPSLLSSLTIIHQGYCAWESWHTDTPPCYWVKAKRLLCSVSNKVTHFAVPWQHMEMSLLCAIQCQLNWRKQYAYSTTAHNSATLMRTAITNGLCDKGCNNYQAAVWKCCFKPKPHTPSPHMAMAGTLVMGPSPLRGCHNHKLLKAYWTPLSIATNLHIHVAQGVGGAGREICSALTCACSTHCFNMDSTECDDKDSYLD